MYQTIPSSSPAATQDAPGDKETRYKGYAEKQRACRGDSKSPAT